jgi:ubiquinone/menaquinone biosynthesis C-methylase UbiE
MSEAEARKQREAELHDEMFSEGARRHISSTYYSITRESDGAYRNLLLSRCPGAEVLEYGCGLGSSAYMLAEHGAARVTGIDISPIAIEKATERAMREDHSGLDFRVMDAERLEFPADSFDLVCGTGILHHLDLDAALGELRRILRSDGLAVFVEPLAHNPVINLYRRRTPDVRTPDEHPLKMSDLEEAGRHFGSVDKRFFHLQTLLAVPLRNTRAFNAALRALAAADRGVFRAAPFLRRYAWQVMIEFREPRG